MAETIREVITELEKIVEECIETESRSGYFAALYWRVTCAVSRKIDEGYFDDNARMEKLDVAFANYYLQAYKSHKSHMPCNSPWQTAFSASATWPPMIIHHLFVGMNAHIGLDLGVATADTSRNGDINLIRNDFNKINAVLEELTEEVKQQLFSLWPLSRYIVKLKLGKVENRLAAFSMTYARDAAWKVATDYSVVTSEELQHKYLEERCEVVTAFSKCLLTTKWWIQFLFLCMRIFETGSISSKIRKLYKG